MAIYGLKTGMTRWINNDSGAVDAVTVLHCTPNVITKIMTAETNGYSAVQVAFGKTSARKINKPELGVFRAISQEPAKNLREIRSSDYTIPVDKKVGDSITIDFIKPGDFIDVTATSIGKGFAGCVKRHNFKTQDATHGNSLAHRAPGSIGQCQDPGRVFKGKKMAGRMGGVTVTNQSLEVIHVDTEKHIILVKGSVPGHKGTMVYVKPAVKKQNKKGA